MKLPYQFLKPFEPFDELTAEDLPAIRGQVHCLIEKLKFRFYINLFEQGQANTTSNVLPWVRFDPKYDRGA